MLNLFMKSRHFRAQQLAAHHHAMDRIAGMTENETIKQSIPECLGNGWMLRVNQNHVGTISGHDPSGFHADRRGATGGRLVKQVPAH
jgi:hypothetical protein